MLAALNCQHEGSPPCAFMMFKGLKSRCRDEAQFIARQLEMGLDVVVNLPRRDAQVVNDHYNLHGLPVSYDPRVEISEWQEHPAGESTPLLVKEYHTPGGVLRAEVCRSDDWRWGAHIPFLDDYIIPRARKHLVTKEEDLDALRYLLVPPTEAETADFHAGNAPLLEIARREGLLVSGGWGVGADLIGWICGLEQMVFLSFDRPAFLRDLLDLIAQWNRVRMAVVLSAGIDLFIKRAWYENCDFWSPKSWRRFIQPILAADVEMAHAAGTRFGYILTANAMPLIDAILECGVDVLIGVDPQQYDLAGLAKKARGRLCLWGGVNGHLTVETGLLEAVQQETRRALETLAPGGGFILSPVDNVREWSPEIERNVQALIHTWKEYRG